MASGKFIDVSLLGDKELARRFKRIEIKAQRKIFRRAVREAARPVLGLAKIMVPVATGRLRDSLRIRALTGVRGAVGAKIETGTREQLGISKDDRYFYPTVVEYKHQSYLRRAIDDDPEGTRRRLARLIRAGIETGI